MAIGTEVGVSGILGLVGDVGTVEAGCVGIGVEEDGEKDSQICR